MSGGGITHGRVRVFLPIILLGVLAKSCLAHDASTPSRPAVAPEGDGSALLLVRAWDPKSGQLVGWLPMHRVAITLRQIGGEALNFDLNEAVNVKLPSRPREDSDGDALRIVPEFATFQGRKWLPVQRDVNIVRVRKALFYVKSIIFGESKWRLAARSRDEQ